MNENPMPSPYARRTARQVGEVAGHVYVIGPEASRRGQWFAEERLQGRVTVRRRFKSEELAVAQALRWENFRRLQQEHPL